VSGPTSKKNLRIVAAVIIVIIVIVAGVGAYYYYSSTSSSSSMVMSSTMMSPTVSASPTLILYSADSFVIESTVLETAFTSSTGIAMAPPKAGGSLLLASEIAQGNPVSVFISLSHGAVTAAHLGNQSSGWAIAFASDQMTLAYSNATLQNSAANATVTACKSALAANTTMAWGNCFTMLTSGSVKVGTGNPNADPSGYRGWIVLEAAGQAYANNSSFYENRLISNNGNVTAASAADLIAPLQTGQIQFLWIYKSSAIAHNLNYLQLPEQVNLGDPKYSSFYSQFSYQLATGIETGGVIRLWITVPADSTDTADSLQFVAFVVKNSPTLLSQYGLLLTTPAKLYNSTTVPPLLQQLVSQGYLQPSGPNSG
jgi:molybdate/tungstate transport system substrate-binding protein